MSEELTEIKVEFKGNFEKVINVFLLLGEIITPRYIDSFGNRIKIQKIVFLLTLKGVDFGYDDHDMYIRGVYSVSLNKDMFVFKEAMEKIGYNDSRIEGLKENMEELIIE